MDASVLARAREDVGVFAEVLVGEPLWPHQLEVARSPARIRSVCSGRQAGKSRTLAVLGLHEAFTVPGSWTLVLSAGEQAARDLLAEVAALASSPLLAGSVVDESRSQVTLSTGSVVRSVPASTKQIRGQSIDLLILDEACFIEEEIWRAARWTVIARPGSRVVMASTPWGRRDGFFAVAWRAGESGESGHASFRWPSTVSPLVDGDLLEVWRRSSTDREWRAEVLAEWVDEAGAYFTADELEGSVAEYRMIDPMEAAGQVVAGGVDWGFARDANALALLGVLSDGDLNVGAHPDEVVFFVAHLEERFGMRYSDFIDRVVDVADRDRGGFYVRTLASETNGVGQMPTEQLVDRCSERGTGTLVAPVHTDARRKESAFGAIKMLLQQGRLVLPRHPSLLRQLAALEFETTELGNVRIAVPERAGHDDLAMALAQATSCLRVGWPGRSREIHREGDGDVLVTGAGTLIHERPRCVPARSHFKAPRGVEDGDGW